MHEPIEECDGGGLADMLCDQIVAFGHRRPAVARVVVDEEVVLLVLAWRDGADKELLDRAAPALGELVDLDRRQEVLDLRTAVTADGCRAMVSFVLAASAGRDVHAERHADPCRVRARPAADVTREEPGLFTRRVANAPRARRPAGRRAY
jgi:hypothetical protein